MLLAVPVTADAPYSLIVDNVLVDKPVVMIDGTAYVPIRAVADILMQLRMGRRDWHYHHNEKGGAGTTADKRGGCRVRKKD